MKRDEKRMLTLKSSFYLAYFSRYEGPTLNGVFPIVTVFDNISQKALLWSKIKENVKNSTIVVTQFDGSKLDKKKQRENGLFLKIFGPFHKCKYI